ncbi:Bug family tripartite tricarboxylate transporter substrate binding protein [Ramlibacter sp.]|uniref:Bug family tripartite tricarboxylate transporter substrate binding protein n=1 Tax=Ramlibacter sp. TaxID=1917967 RepID=UPI003D0EC126
MRTFSILRTLGVALGLALGASLVAAQPAAGRPIRLVVPLPAGTATDLAARVLGQQMSVALGQPVVVDNKPGANGVIGTMEVVRAAPDGLTLLLGSQSPIASNVALVKNLSYDPRKDFTPINGFGETMHVLMVRPDHPAKSLADFIAYAKQRPGKVSVGTTTSSVNIQIATLNKLGGLELLPVPYKGIPATLTDVIGGTLDASMVDLANALAQAKSGRLRPLAVTSLKRNPLVPDWPAIAETLPGFDFPSWVALVGPANMPRELAQKLNESVAVAMKHPEVVEKLAGIGMSPMPMTTAQFTTFLDKEVVKWVRLAREANVQPE